MDDEKNTYVKESLKKIRINRACIPLPPKIEEEDFKDDPVYYLNAEIMPKPVGGMAVIYKKLY